MDSDDARVDIRTKGLARRMAKPYSAAAVSLSCRMKSPFLSLGAGVDVLDVFLGGSAPLSWLGLRPLFTDKIFNILCILIS